MRGGQGRTAPGACQKIGPEGEDAKRQYAERQREKQYVVIQDPPQCSLEKF